jgi:hypothetical protein
MSWCPRPFVLLCPSIRPMRAEAESTLRQVEEAADQGGIGGQHRILVHGRRDTAPDQVHWHEPKTGENARLGKFKRPLMPYDRFIEAEDVPVYRGIGVRRVQDLPMAPWKRLGGRGSYIQLYGTEGLYPKQGTHSVGADWPTCATVPSNGAASG